MVNVFKNGIKSIEDMVNGDSETLDRMRGSNKNFKKYCQRPTAETLRNVSFAVLGTVYQQSKSIQDSLDAQGSQDPIPQVDGGENGAETEPGAAVQAQTALNSKPKTVKLTCADVQEILSMYSGAE